MEKRKDPERQIIDNLESSKDNYVKLRIDNKIKYIPIDKIEKLVIRGIKIL